MVGNFLNAGSFVGDAEAFTVDSLLKVRSPILEWGLDLRQLTVDGQLQITDVTSTKGGDHSLLDYVISLLLRTKPEYLNFANELRHVKMAAQGAHSSRLLLHMWGFLEAEAASLTQTGSR